MAIPVFVLLGMIDVDQMSRLAAIFQLNRELKATASETLLYLMNGTDPPAFRQVPAPGTAELQALV